MNPKGNAAPEARGAKPFQHSNIYYDTFFSQNAAVAIFQKGLSQKCGKCGNFFIKCGQNFENVGPLGTLHLINSVMSVFQVLPRSECSLNVPPT